MLVSLLIVSYFLIGLIVSAAIFAEDIAIWNYSSEDRPWYLKSCVWDSEPTYDQVLQRDYEHYVWIFIWPLVIIIGLLSLVIRIIHWIANNIFQILVKGMVYLQKEARNPRENV